jgi:hypothetical protein
MPVPPVPDSRRFAKHLTGIIHSELLEIPGVASQEMRLVRHDPLTEAGPTTCAEIDVASVSGSRARIVVYPLPPVDTGLTDEELERPRISPEIDVESLDLCRPVTGSQDQPDLACLVASGHARRAREYVSAIKRSSSGKRK